MSASPGASTDGKARLGAQVVLAGVAIVGILAGGLWVLNLVVDLVASRTDEAAGAWPGPVRPGVAVVPLEQAPDLEDGEHSDGLDARIPFVDITRLTARVEGQPHWWIELAAKPPNAKALDPAQTLISYGLVLDTTGEGIADFIVGINNDGPHPGDFRVWVTNIATGATETQLGPPYGYPVEFSHPDEWDADDPIPRQSALVFTFLGGSEPAGFSAATRFYAWSSLTGAGGQPAWDYAPDVGWLVAP